MRNFTSLSNPVQIPAPYDVKAGGFVRVGGIFGFAQADALLGAEVAVVTGGAFVFPVAAAANVDAGEPIYADEANVLTADAGADNLLVGHALYDATATAGTADIHVLLLGR